MYNSYIKRPVQVRSPYHLTSVRSINAFAFTMGNPQQSAGAFFFVIKAYLEAECC